MSQAKDCAACGRTFIAATLSADMCNDCSYMGREAKPVQQAIREREARGEKVHHVTADGDLKVRWDDEDQLVILDTGRSVIEFTIAQATMLKDALSMAIRRLQAG